MTTSNADHPAEMTYAKSFDGCRLRLVVEGDPSRPAVLFINSIGLDHRMWDRQVEALAGGCRTLRYDSRGHGASDVPAGEYTIEMLGRDALAVLDGAGADRAMLVGSSIGGMTAMWLAAMHPDRIERLVLANTTAHIGRPEAWDARIAEIRQGRMAEVAEATAARWLSDGFRNERPEDAAWLASQLRRTPADGFAGMCAVLRDVDLRGHLARIVAPTLVIGGAMHLAEAIAGASFVEVPQTGHLSNFESPEAFNAALVRFLNLPNC